MPTCPPVSAEALADFDRAAPQAQAQARVEQLCLDQDRPEQAMGPEAGAMIRSGMKFVTDMLRSAMAFSAGEILHDEMEWGKARLPAYGVALDMVLRNLERYRDALQHTMPPEAFAEVKLFSGIIPICMHCKQIQNDRGYWVKLEQFISTHSEAQFSHSICDECLEKFYPDED